MKTLVFLGGPIHGTIRFEPEMVDPFYVPLPHDAMEIVQNTFYRLAFADQWVGIYYWRLNQYQVNAIRQQVVLLRNRFEEHDTPTTAPPH